MSKKVYCGGDLLKLGSQLLRQREKEDIEALGYITHSPKDDKEINDKTAQTVESNNKLAERIVEKDTQGIISSDIIILEPTNDALGTCVELGQVKGMKDMAEMILILLQEYKNDQGKLDAITSVCTEMMSKKVYTHYEDVRRTDLPEVGDRRSWGVNQYVYGTCLSLTGGKGFYEWDEILKELKKNRR